VAAEATTAKKMGQRAEDSRKARAEQAVRRQAVRQGQERQQRR
jgi:hypothetical protein